MDGQHPQGEAGEPQHVREVDTGRDHPRQADDGNLLQLRPQGSHPRKLGVQPSPGQGQLRHLRDAALRSDRDVRASRPDGAPEYSKSYKNSRSAL